MVNKKGFTLIELLIVIVLITMMIVVAVPQFSKFGRRSDLSIKAEEFRLLIENAHKYSNSPELNFEGSIITFNFTTDTKTVANKAKFNNIDEPWNGSTTSSWLEISVPSDMELINLVGSDNRIKAYFVSPGIYLKENANTAIAFQLRYKDDNNTDFIDIHILPTKTSPTTSQNLMVNINESWN